MQEDEFFKRMKCARIIDRFARIAHIGLSGALTFFYKTPEYVELSQNSEELEKVQEDEMVQALVSKYMASLDEEQENQ